MQNKTRSKQKEEVIVLSGKHTNSLFQKFKQAPARQSNGGEAEN